MTDADLSVAATIVRNIDLLEEVRDYLATTMDPVLGQAVGELLTRKRDEFGWTGEIGMELGGPMYMAPHDWKMENGEEDAFDLYVAFGGTNDNDLYWISNFAGVSETGIEFEVASDSGRVAAVRKALKAIFKSDPTLLENLRASGFSWSPEGRLTMPVTITREALAAAFEDEDFDTALTPIAEALDRIHAARKHLDLLVDRIRGEAG